MRTRRSLMLVAGAAILALFVYLQFRTWKDFDWGVFWQHTRAADFARVALAVAIIYLDYFLRALRWKIFMQPVCRTRAGRLVAPTIIGFAGLALLGRPGELVRPYLIARKENTTLPAQLAVWAVERIFDIGAFTVLLVASIFLAPRLPYAAQFHKAGFALSAFVILFSALLYALRRNSAGVSGWTERALARISPDAARHLAQKLRAFGEGLHTIPNWTAFAQTLTLSLVIWVLIVVAAQQVAHAYPQPLRSMTFAWAVLLIGFSMAGSIVQLPAVGGGTQLAVIAGLVHVFRVPQELAVSCGIMLWLVTFVAVVPAGLALAHREHVSLRTAAQSQATG